MLGSRRVRGLAAVGRWPSSWGWFPGVRAGGRYGDRILVGDWNGDGTWTPGVLRGGSRWYLKDSLSGGAASAGLRKQTPAPRWPATGTTGPEQPPGKAWTGTGRCR
jgi:hypothetical protein